MNKAFEKILFKIEEHFDSTENRDMRLSYHHAMEIVKEVAEEYKRDMKYNLAEMYAKNMVDYGVNVTEAWQTATQQSCALEKAYIRGRQYEVDRFNKLRKEYNGGWISCSERLPEAYGEYLVWWTDITRGQYYEIVEYEPNNGWIGEIPQAFEGKYSIIAWQPLPEPYQPKGE